MQQSISKKEFLSKNPSAVELVLSMTIKELASFQRDVRVFIESYVFSGSKFEVICHV